MLSPELFAALSQRALMDNQFASELVRMARPRLNELAKYIRERLSREGVSIETQKRLDKLTSDIKTRSDATYNAIVSDYFKELYDLAEDEALFTVSAIRAVVTAGVAVAKAKRKKVGQTVRNNPIVVGNNNQSRDFVKYIQSISGFSDEIASSIVGGYHQGQTVQQITGAIIGTRSAQFQDGLIDKSRRDISTIVRTAITHISTQSRMAVFEANKDISFGYRIVATIDSRTSTVCRGYDGQVFRYDARFQPKPPFHLNCVLPDTDVITCGGVSNIFKRAYKGAVIDIATKSGKTLSITPNHPILTSRGWLAAKDVDTSDKLATITDKHVVVNDQEDCVEAKASDLFTACDIASNSRFITNAPTSAKDFHGDVTDSKVSIISTDSLIWSDVKAILNKKVENSFFMRGVNRAFSGFCSLTSFFKRNMATFGGFVSGLNKQFFSLVISPIHSCLLLLRPSSGVTKSINNKPFYWGFAARKPEMASYTSNPYSAFVRLYNFKLFPVGKPHNRFIDTFNASELKGSVNRVSAHADALPDFLNANTVNGVEFDDIVNIGVREYEGHVYNLENKNNWYVSNGIITHNCRTSIVPEISGKSLADTSATRAVAFKGGTVGQVSAQKQYYEILKNQPKDIQDAVLGKARGLIFRNSGLSADEFRKALTDTMGNPLTLAEMAEKNKVILDYMNKNNFLQDYLPDG